MRKIAFACVIGLIFISIGFAAFQRPSWDAPPDIKQKKNPVAPSEAVLKEAKSIYLDKCSNCGSDRCEVHEQAHRRRNVLQADGRQEAHALICKTPHRGAALGHGDLHAHPGWIFNRAKK